MINKIKLKFGSSDRQPPVEFKPPAVTVFVGPNNSGKSKILNEISHLCCVGIQDTNYDLIDQIKFISFDSENAKNEIEKITLTPRTGDMLAHGDIYIGKKSNRRLVNKQYIENILLDPNDPNNNPGFSQLFVNNYTIVLDGRNRINLINTQEAGDLQQEPHTSFQVLVQDTVKREEVRRIIFDAFGSYFAIDLTNLGKLRLRLAQRKPNSELEEIGVHSEARDYQNNAIPIEHHSDGVKAYVGIIIEIIAGDPKILILDEPEAFLHPSLAFKLGKEISSNAMNKDIRVFISTHSSNFLMGCIQSGVPVNIVRLTYRDAIPTARILHNSDLLKLMRNPLLRSMNVISSLFYEFVVVTEGDADRAFYQEINERLLKEKPEKGIPNCLFINAQNKQTIRTIVKPLRALGIPVVGIVDIDIFKDGGSDWNGFLESGFIPEIDCKSMQLYRSQLLEKLKFTGKDFKKEGGINVLDKDAKESALNLINKLGEYGLFVVKNGELESWLSHLKVKYSHSPGWLVEIFEKMGEDPGAVDYVKPTEGDVWDFIYDMRKWFMNPKRKGIPI